MAGDRIALVGGASVLLDSVQEFMRSQIGAPALHRSWGQIELHLDRDTDGILLLLAAIPADLEPVKDLVKTIRVMKLPPTVVLVQGPDMLAEKLVALDEHVFSRYRWPKDSSSLARLIQDRAGRRRAFFITPEQPLEELLRRQLSSRTPSLLPLAGHIALAARHDVTVLLTGETGTGKTFLARLIHDYSPRKDQRFLPVACGAVSANLVESEFFGHERGAFTGADRAKIGKFTAVGAGTLLLDEIDTLQFDQQSTLLRVIETGEFEPVGSNVTHRSLARLIVASNCDLEQAVLCGKFRQDLFFRLNVMSFHLPPLRERIQDIAPMVRALVARFNRKFTRELFDVSPEAMAALEAYPWPGNLRQLENVIQQAVLISTGTELSLNDLPPAVRDKASRAIGMNGHSQSNGLLQYQRDMTERGTIQRILELHGYSTTHAASALGISRVTLYTKMKKYGLTPP